MNHLGTITIPRRSIFHKHILNHSRWNAYTQLEISVYSPHILYIILTYYLVQFRNSNFMYIMCTQRVVGVCVAWSAYIKEKNYTYFVCTLHISYVFVYYEQRILTGFEPTTFILPIRFA